MPVAPGDIVKITANLLLDGSNSIQNVFHFLVVAEPGSPGDDDFMNGVDDIMDDLYLTINSRVSDRISYDSITGINVSKSELLPSRAWPTLTVGGDPDVMLPEMSAGCVFHRTIKPKVRASKFLPPATQQSNDGGALGVIYRVALQAFGDFLVGLIIEGGTELTYGAFNRLTSVFTPAGQAIVPNRFRTQRRRRIGVGS